MTPDDTETLRISGLSAAAEQTCRKIYDDFLKDHELESYPVNITVARTSRQYLLEISCGQLNVNQTRHSGLTSTPEAGIGQLLHRMIELNYEYHQTMVRNRNT